MVSVQSLVAKIYEKQIGMPPDVFIETWTLTPFEALELCESLSASPLQLFDLRGRPKPNPSTRLSFGMLERGEVHIAGVRILVE